LARVNAAAPSLVSNNLSFAARYAVKRLRLALPMFGGGRPAVTYAAYRTASTAIHHAIRGAGLGLSVKAHMLARENMVAEVSQRQGFHDASANLPRSCHVGDWAVRLGIIEPRRPADFVIPVRDPWAVAHSIFVLSAPNFDSRFTSIGAVDAPASFAQAVDLAESIIFGGFPRELMLRWIRDDAAPALGWDPLSRPFDVERGASEYEHGPWRIQILRTDLSDERKSEVLQHFLGRPTLRVVAKNSSASFGPERGVIAEVARAAIARRPDAVRALLDDPVCAHYWSDAQRDRMHARWTTPRATQG
jgi:hypothetical protein